MLVVPRSYSVDSVKLFGEVFMLGLLAPWRVKNRTRYQNAESENLSCPPGLAQQVPAVALMK